MFPVTVEFPTLNNATTFEQPSIYAGQDFSFDWIGSNLMCVAQLVGLVLLYYALSRVRVRTENCMVKQFQSRYTKTFYANTIETYLSSHIGLAFGATAATLDRSFTGPYKVYNWIAMVLMLLIVVLLPFIHPLLLRMSKRKTE